MPAKAENKDILGRSVVVEPISQTVGRFGLRGAHLWSQELNSTKKGDGYSVLELSNGKHLLLVVDISLGHYDRATPIMDEERKPINESRILQELLQVAESPASVDPAAFIQHLSQNYHPDYLRDRGVRWGFSLTVALLDPASPNIKAAAVGTNFYGIGQGDNHFLVAHSPDRNFFSPHRGKLDIFDIRTAEINRNIHPSLLVSTDGVVLTKRGLWGWGGQEVDLKGKPERLLGHNSEGLYLVISPSTSLRVNPSPSST